ncbi:unnamed protein product [Meganyctiphanes norvegica]|uniref:Uncharacterized protein n=1 Tax=Meganyctiphanes norvegica TaxID=48144 RepID=A0AAV2QYY0_MEGNR
MREKMLVLVLWCVVHLTTGQQQQQQQLVMSNNLTGAVEQTLIQQIPPQIISQQVSSDVINDAEELSSSSVMESRQGEVEEQDARVSYGPVSSPFFFMCHYPQPGESASVTQEEVTIKLEFVGQNKPTQGYKPGAVYEVAITANVLFDGFLVTEYMP